MKNKAAIKWISVLIIAIILTSSFSKVFRYSIYFNKSENELATYNNEYYSLLYEFSEVAKDEFIVNFGLMGGIFMVGNITTINNENIYIDVKKRSGDIRFLIINESSKEGIFFDQVLNKENKISLSEGNYKLFLVGNWFSGNCRINFSEKVRFQEYTP